MEQGGVCSQSNIKIDRRSLINTMKTEKRQSPVSQVDEDVAGDGAGVGVAADGVGTEAAATTPVECSAAEEIFWHLGAGVGIDYGCSRK